MHSITEQSSYIVYESEFPLKNIYRSLSLSFCFIRLTSLFPTTVWHLVYTRGVNYYIIHNSLILLYPTYWGYNNYILLILLIIIIICSFRRVLSVGTFAYYLCVCVHFHELHVHDQPTIPEVNAVNRWTTLLIIVFV